MFAYQEINNNNLLTQTKGLELVKPQKKQQGVTLNPKAQGILQKHFVYSILGKPGSGKSHLISQLLTRQIFYGNKFNRIIYITPSQFKGILHDKFNTTANLNIQWIFKHIKQAQQWGCKNLLIVFDDVISQIPKTHPNILQKLLYNRRHIMKTGCISIIITTQKYTSCPKWLRQCSTGIFTFPLMVAQAQVMMKQNCAKKQKKNYVQRISNLEKHKFVFINNENYKIFNSHFAQI